MGCLVCCVHFFVRLVLEYALRLDPSHFLSPNWLCWLIRGVQTLDHWFSPYLGIGCGGGGWGLERVFGIATPHFMKCACSQPRLWGSALVLLAVHFGAFLSVSANLGIYPNDYSTAIVRFFHSARPDLMGTSYCSTQFRMIACRE